MDSYMATAPAVGPLGAGNSNVARTRERCASGVQVLGEGGNGRDAGVAGKTGGEVAGECAGYFERAAAAGGELGNP